MNWRPRWAYQIESRKRHGKWWFAVIRSDDKEIAEVADLKQAWAIKARFDKWARQPWEHRSCQLTR